MMKKSSSSFILILSLTQSLWGGISGIHRLQQQLEGPYQEDLEDLGFRSSGGVALHIAPVPGRHGEGARPVQDRSHGLSFFELAHSVVQTIASTDNENPTPEESRIALAASTCVGAASTTFFLPGFGTLFGLPLSYITSKILNGMFLEKKTRRHHDSGFALGASLACLFHWCKSKAPTN